MNRVKTILSQMGNAKTVRSGKKEGLRLTTVIPMRIERHHATKVIISPEDKDPRTNAKPWRATMDAKLIKALGRAVYWQHLIDTGRVANMTELARAEGMDKVRVHKILKLARLSPAIAERVACAKGPVGLSFEFFMRKQLPDSWEEQEALIEGLATKEAKFKSPEPTTSVPKHDARRAA